MTETRGPKTSLGEEDEAELFARAAEDPAAREQLAERYSPLARYLARRLAGRGEPVEDLVQVAHVGLLSAIDRFDPSREVKFSTFATTTIVGELKHHFRDTGWAVRVPRRLQEMGLKLSRLVPELSHELGRSPTIKEIAKRADLSEEEVLEAMDSQQAYTAVSLDAPFDEGSSPAETLGSEDETLGLMDAWASVAPAIRQLPARERRILYLRFFRGQSQTEIAEELGISQMHVSRLLARTLERLRVNLG